MIRVKIDNMFVSFRADIINNILIVKYECMEYELPLDDSIIVVRKIICLYDKNFEMFDDTSINLSSYIASICHNFQFRSKG